MDYTKSETLNLAELEKGIFDALEISMMVLKEGETATAPVPEKPVIDKKWNILLLITEKQREKTKYRKLQNC